MTDIYELILDIDKATGNKVVLTCPDELSNVYVVKYKDETTTFQEEEKLRRYLEGLLNKVLKEKTPQSIKNDIKDGKLRWELLPLELIEPIVRVFTFGAKKYAPWTWNKLDNGYERYKAAMLRHLLAFERGEFSDPESGLPHLAHVLWNAMAMYYFGVKDHENNITEENRREQIKKAL